MGDLLQTVSSVSPGYNKLVNGTLPLKHTSEQTARCCPCREHPHEQSILFLQLDAALMSIQPSSHYLSVAHAILCQPQELLKESSLGPFLSSAN